MTSKIMEQLRKFRISSIGNFLVRLFGLEVYPESKLLTKHVRVWMTIFAILIVGMMPLEYIFWHALWGYVFPEAHPVPEILASVFTVLLALLERSIVTTGFQWRVIGDYVPFVGRVALLGLSMFVLSIPAQLSIFAPEIDAEIRAEKDGEVEIIRTAAVAKIKDQFKTRLADFDAATTAQLTQVAEKSIEEKLANDPRLIQLRSEQAKYADRIDFEIGFAHAKTCGKVCTDYKVAKKEVEKEIDRLETGIRNTHSTVVKTAVDTGTTSRKKIDIEGQNKLDAIAKMSAGDLYKQYAPETQNKQYGFRARYAMLEKVLAEDEHNRKIALATQLAIAIFGLSVLFLKLLAPKEFQLYYQLEAQAAAGHEEAKQASQVTPEMRTLPDKYREARVELAKKVGGFEAYRRNLCAPRVE